MTLRTIKGIGDFIAYQVWVDWTYIQEYPFSENWFTVAGPGCKKGLKILFPNWPRGYTAEEALLYLVANQEGLLQQPWNTYTDRPEGDQHINLMAMENVMCEFSKYHRILSGQNIKPRKPIAPAQIMRGV